MEERDPDTRSLIIQYLVAHTRCSGCGQHYEAEDVHVHSHRGQVWLASLTCHQCGLRAMVMAAMQAPGEEAEPPVAAPDDAQELATLRTLGPITADELLDLHRFLEGFSGDMQNLIRP